MAADTLPRPPVPAQIPAVQIKSGVLTLWGYGVKCRIEQGHFVASWGCGLDRYSIRLSRVEGRKLHRLVCISIDGFLTLDVLEWLSGISASFICLDRRGKVRFVTGPTAPTDSKIRRAQATAVNSGLGLEISRTLIDAKLQGQERVIRERLNDPTTADIIGKFRARLPEAENFEMLRLLEAHASIAYFQRIAKVEVIWPKADRRKIPQTWLTVGSRQSPLSGGPRLSVTPFHALMNYSAALLESATRIAITSVGLLPDIGLGLHTDTPNRDSLVFDCCEPVRPLLEEWLLSWVMTERLSRADFFEIETGQVRLATSLCIRLSGIMPTLEKLVSPWVEYVQRVLWQSTSQSKSTWQRTPATRLTQQHRREAKGQPSFPRIEALPRPEPRCTNCGSVRIKRDKRRNLCGKCGRRVSLRNFRAGRRLAHTPESRAKRAATQRQRRAENRAFDPSSLPAWLTRGFYTSRIAPALAKVSRPSIRSATGMSEPHAARIQKGVIPHMRHWPALASLLI